MKKKLIISLSIVFGIIAVLLILFWTLFGLRSITVSFSTTLENLTVSEEEIVQAGEFNKGACVLFEGKKKSIRKIEQYVSKNANFAYISVLNIETVFPNKFVIHIAEREELFAIPFGDETLICDRELRVLRSVEDYISDQSNAMFLEGLTIKNEEVEIGDFLDVEETGIKTLYSAFVENNRNLNEQRGKFEKITLSHYQDEYTKKEYVKAELVTFSGRIFEIYNLDFALSNKIQLMYAVESSLLGYDVDESGNLLDNEGNLIYIKKLETGEYSSFVEGVDDEGDKLTLNLEIVSNCKIRVDNLTLSDYVHRDENDIYFALVSV